MAAAFLTSPGAATTGVNLAPIPQLAAFSLASIGNHSQFDLHRHILVDQQVQQLQQLERRMDSIQQDNKNPADAPPRRGGPASGRRSKNNSSNKNTTPVPADPNPASFGIRDNPGPIALRNDIPILPLYAYSVLSNGTLAQIPVSFCFTSHVFYLSRSFPHGHMSCPANPI